MNIFISFVLCLILTGCITAGQKNNGPAMPETFLGYWNHSATDCVDSYIHPDGHIDFFCPEMNEEIDRYDYKVIHVAGPKDVYIVAKESWKEWYYHKGDFYLYMHLWIEKSDPTNDDLLKWEYSFPLTQEQWNSYTPDQFWLDYQDNIKPGFQAGGGTENHTRLTNDVAAAYLERQHLTKHFLY